MKLPTCAPITVNDQPYTLADMVTHVTMKERRYNTTAADARQGKRTREAVATGANISAEDLKKLAEVLERPGCGWGEFVLTQKMPRPDGTAVDVMRRAQFPTYLFLPLIDCVQSAAASAG